MLFQNLPSIFYLDIEDAEISATDWQHNGQFSIQFSMQFSTQTHIRIMNIYAISKYIKDLQIYNILSTVYELYAYIPHYHCLAVFLLSKDINFCVMMLFSRFFESILPPW